MTDPRYKDVNWTINKNGGLGYSIDEAQLAVLMDIRAELKSLNGLLRCPNFLDIPHLLRDVRRNTTKRRKPRGAR